MSNCKNLESSYHLFAPWIIQFYNMLSPPHGRARLIKDINVFPISNQTIYIFTFSKK